jgi:hypothetical protein
MGHDVSPARVHAITSGAASAFYMSPKLSVVQACRGRAMGQCGAETGPEFNPAEAFADPPVTKARRSPAGTECDGLEKECHMITNVKNLVLYAWNFIFDHEVSPVRNIPDIAVRHYVLQALGLMWATSASLAIGSYTFFAYSWIGHALLIAAAAITVATLTTASTKPLMFVRTSGRRQDGEHI